MEPFTTAIVGKFLWDNIGKVILDKAKERYSEKLLEKIENILSKIPFNKKEFEIIETEIVNADMDTFKNEDSFLEYIDNNEKIIKILNELNKREYTINIQVEKGIGYIHTNTGDINF